MCFAGFYHLPSTGVRWQRSITPLHVILLADGASSSKEDHEGAPLSGSPAGKGCKLKTACCFLQVERCGTLLLNLLLDMIFFSELAFLFEGPPYMVKSIIYFFTFPAHFFVSYCPLFSIPFSAMYQRKIFYTNFI